MPIRKFHSIEEMKQRAWRQPGDPSLYCSMRFVLEVGRRTRPRRFPAGVHKHGSIEAMNIQTERWREEPSIAAVGRKSEALERRRRIQPDERYGSLVK